MKTGKGVQKNWLYASDCCLLEVMFDSGDSFSRCPQCSNLCDWEMVDVKSVELKTLIGTSRPAKPWARRSHSTELALRHSN